MIFSWVFVSQYFLPLIYKENTDIKCSVLRKLLLLHFIVKAEPTNQKMLQSIFVPTLFIVQLFLINRLTTREKNQTRKKARVYKELDSFNEKTSIGFCTSYCNGATVPVCQIVWARSQTYLNYILAPYPSSDAKHQLYCVLFWIKILSHFNTSRTTCSQQVVSKCCSHHRCENAKQNCINIGY